VIWQTALAPAAPPHGSYRSRVRYWLRRWAILGAGDPMPLRRPAASPTPPPKPAPQPRPAQAQAQAQPRPQTAPPPKAAKKPAWPRNLDTAALAKRLRALLETDLSELRLSSAQLACVCAAIFAGILVVGLILPPLR